jgi:ATP-dependent helicase/nuclease subunit A
MRVLYVAMTRARDRLIMTYSAENLQSELQEIALRMDFDGGELLCRDVVCPGEWVLMAAMQRTEAGELFALGGKPKETYVSEIPWKIVVTEAPVDLESGTQTGIAGKVLPDGAEERIRAGLAFRYGHEAATQAPSKQTATGRKGRIKDAEAAENTREKPHGARDWRKPSFVENGFHGKTYGSAIHSAMQYIRYEVCSDENAVALEVHRLVQAGFLTEEQGSLVNCGKIAAFFESEIGKKLRSGTEHLREFKFSILDDGSHYGENLEGEQVLLQGVVDCALLEEDGITVVDFKTDYVTEETLSQVTERYRPQVQTYGDALRRIYEQPIKGMYLYFFHIDRFVEI